MISWYTTSTVTCGCKSFALVSKLSENVGTGVISVQSREGLSLRRTRIVSGIYCSHQVCVRGLQCLHTAEITLNHTDSYSWFYFRWSLKVAVYLLESLIVCF